MSFTDFLESALLSHVFGNTAYTPPATVYVGLFTLAPNDTGGGTEVSGGAYARQALPGVTISGTTPTQAANSTTIEFPTATADWGDVTHCAWFDAQTGGTMLAHAPLLTPRNVRNGDAIRFPVGTLIVALG